MSISVCIPTYNSGETLRICLDSIFRQTVKPEEVLICDDGSNDETLQIIKEYPVKTVTKNRKGLGASRSALTAAASGELIAWIDSDAAIPPNWLELRVESHQTQPEIDCLCGPAKVVSVKEGERLSRQRLNAKSPKLRRSDILSWTAVTMKRQTIEKVGGFDPIFEFDGDWDFTNRLVRGGASIHWCDEWLGYHMHPKKVTRWSLKKHVMSGNFVLYFLKYGPKYAKLNPRHFAAFALRIWLLYSLLLFPFFIPLALFSLVGAIVFNLVALKLHANRLRLEYLLEQLLKAIGEHRNFVRHLAYRLSRRKTPDKM